MAGALGRDHEVGSAGRDLMASYGGNDVLRSGAGSDAFYGGPGVDLLWAEAADDTRTAGGRHDTLNGGVGADLLQRGSGHGTFFFDEGRSGGDVVTDFRHGFDLVGLSGVAFGLAPEDQVTLVQGGAAQPAGPDPTFLCDTVTHRLWFDSDSTGGKAEALLVATLQSVVALSVSDFMLI